MNKQKLRNKAITDLIEDAQDGRVKKSTLDKLKDTDKNKNCKGYCYGGSCYETLDEIPVPRTQKDRFLAEGKIEKCK